MRTFDPLETIKIFDHYGFDGRSFYIMSFGGVPHSISIENVDVDKFYQFALSAYPISSLGSFKDEVYDWTSGTTRVVRAIIILQSTVLIELKQNSCRILFRPNQREVVESMMLEITVLSQSGIV